MNTRREGLGSHLGDPRFVAAALALSVFGIAMIYSAGLTDIPTPVSNAWKRQSIWLLLSIVSFAVASRVPLRWLEWGTP